MSCLVFTFAKFDDSFKVKIDGSVAAGRRPAERRYSRLGLHGFEGLSHGDSRNEPA